MLAMNTWKLSKKNNNNNIYNSIKILNTQEQIWHNRFNTILIKTSAGLF